MMALHASGGMGASSHTHTPAAHATAQPLSRLNRAELEARASAAEAQLTRAQASAERDLARTHVLIEENARLQAVVRELHARVSAAEAASLQEQSSLQRTLVERGGAAMALSAENQKLHEAYKATLARGDALQEQVDSLAGALRRKDTVIAAHESSQGEAQRHVDEVAQLVVELHAEVERERGAHASTRGALDAMRAREAALHEQVGSSVMSTTDAAQRVRDAIAEAQALRARNEELAQGAHDATSALEDTRAELHALRDSHESTIRLYEQQLLEANRRLQMQEVQDATRRQLATVLASPGAPVSLPHRGTPSLAALLGASTTTAAAARSLLYGGSSVGAAEPAAAALAQAASPALPRGAASTFARTAAATAYGAPASVQSLSPPHASAMDAAAAAAPPLSTHDLLSYAQPPPRRADAETAHAVLATRDAAVEAAARSQMEVEALRRELASLQVQQAASQNAALSDRARAGLEARMGKLEAGVRAAQDTVSAHEALARSAVDTAVALSSQLHGADTERAQLVARLASLEQQVAARFGASAPPQDAVAREAAPPAGAREPFPGSVMGALRDGAARLLRSYTEPTLSAGVGARSPPARAPPRDAMSGVAEEAVVRRYEAEIAELRARLEEVETHADTATTRALLKELPQQRGAQRVASDLHFMDSAAGVRRMATSSNLSEPAYDARNEEGAASLMARLAPHLEFRNASVSAPQGMRDADVEVHEPGVVREDAAPAFRRHALESVASPPPTRTQSAHPMSHAPAPMPVQLRATASAGPLYRSPDDTVNMRGGQYALDTRDTASSATDQDGNAAPARSAAASSGSPAGLAADVSELQRQLSETKFQLMRSETSKRLLKMEVEAARTANTRRASSGTSARTGTPSKLRTVRSDAGMRSRSSSAGREAEARGASVSRQNSSARTSVQTDASPPTLRRTATAMPAFRETEATYERQSPLPGPDADRVLHDEEADTLAPEASRHVLVPATSHSRAQPAPSWSSHDTHGGARGSSSFSAARSVRQEGASDEYVSAETRGMRVAHSWASPPTAAQARAQAGSAAPGVTAATRSQQDSRLPTTAPGSARPLMRAALSHITEEGDDARDEHAAADRATWGLPPRRPDDALSIASGSSGTTAVVLDAIPSSMDVLQAGPSTARTVRSDAGVPRGASARSTARSEGSATAPAHESLRRGVSARASAVPEPAPATDDIEFDYANISLDDLAAMVQRDAKDAAAVTAAPRGAHSYAPRGTGGAPQHAASFAVRTTREARAEPRGTMLGHSASAPGLDAHNASASSSGTIERLQRELAQAQRAFKNRDV